MTAVYIAINCLLYINAILVQSYKAPPVAAPLRAAEEYIIYSILKTPAGDRKVFSEYRYIPSYFRDECSNYK